MASDKVISYPGEQVDVTWDGRLCIHVGECGRASNSLFVGGRKPWCQPDEVPAADAVDVVERCPTGALAYTRKDGGPGEAVAAENVVAVANNGPLYLRGDLHIDGAADDMAGVRHRAALCRCGQSKRKPFCDNSHEAGGFVDRGAIGDTGTPLQTSGGPLTIKRAANGPLLLQGAFTMLTPNGRRAWQGTKAALCRCGASANKPFCDGSHRKVGFEAE